MLIGRMNGFQGLVIVDLTPSAWLPRALLTLHVSVMVALLLGYPTSWPRNLLLAAIALHGLWSARAARTLDIARLELSARQTWRVVFCDGRGLDARLLRAPWVSPLLTALTLACADGVERQVVMLPDMVDADAFRRLRVRLRKLDGGDGMA
jgi:hypothetical protein